MKIKYYTWKIKIYLKRNCERSLFAIVYELYRGKERYHAKILFRIPILFKKSCKRRKVWKMRCNFEKDLMSRMNRFVNKQNKFYSLQKLIQTSVITYLDNKMDLDEGMDLRLKQGGR